MVDSGNQFDSGDTFFTQVYGDMVDQALDRPATARMTVRSRQAGNLVSFDVTLTNSSGETLSAANDARVTALLYQEPANTSLIPVVTAAGTTAITTLEAGETATTTLEVGAAGMDPARIRWVVIADYLPEDSDGAYDTLQAVVGP